MGARLGIAIAALAVAVGCGRVGFDPIDGGALDAPPADAVPLDAECVAAALDPCVELAPLAAAPTIDGTLEPCLALVEVVPEGWTDPMPIPTGLAARAAFAWRPDGLYAYVEIDDPDRHPAPAALDTYCGDAIELYADADGTYAVESEYDDPGTVQVIVAAPETEGGSSTRGQRWVFRGASGAWPSSRFVMVARPGGYAIETLVQAVDLGLASWSLEAGGRVGIDLAVDVSTADGSTTADPIDCGSRLGQYFLRVVPRRGDDCGEPYCDSRAFCAPVLR